MRRTPRQRRINTSVPEVISWKEWSKEAFSEAAEGKKLVLLDLSAVWCHWCHVMDQTTYSNPEVIRTINESFIPIRVDIDRRPDLSERYNRGGFPTTAFLSDQGESVWGATYVPPRDMIRIMKAILDAKASGEIDSALERSRLTYLDISKALEKRTIPDSEFASTLFEDVFAGYDVEHGGFGLAPKFPHPDVINLLLLKHSQDNDPEVAEAVKHTLDKMLEGLYDPVEGGVYRYCVSKDWREPHYEKMLETNIGIMGNLVRASISFENLTYKEKAIGIATYLMKSLRDQESGGFFGSQDADEEYYAQPEGERAGRKGPAVDRTVYAGWNAQAATTMIESGALMERKDWVDAGLQAFEYSARDLWNQEMALVRHIKDQDLYIFEDQVSFLESLLAVVEVRPSDGDMNMAKMLIEGIEQSFSSPEGGYDDIPKGGTEIGELATPRRSLASNAIYARALARYGIASHDIELINKAWGILTSFTSKTVQAHGLFAAQYITAWWALEREPVLVEVHNPEDGDPLKSELWLAAKRTMNPGLVSMLAPPHVSASSSKKGEFAVVCTRKGCSKELGRASELLRMLRPQQSSQV